MVLSSNSRRRRDWWREGELPARPRPRLRQSGGEKAPGSEVAGGGGGKEGGGQEVAEVQGCGDGGAEKDPPRRKEQAERRWAAMNPYQKAAVQEGKAATNTSGRGGGTELVRGGTPVGPEDAGGGAGSRMRRWWPV